MRLRPWRVMAITPSSHMNLFIGVFFRLYYDICFEVISLQLRSRRQCDCIPCHLTRLIALSELGGERGVHQSDEIVCADAYYPSHRSRIALLVKNRSNCPLSR